MSGTGSVQEGLRREALFAQANKLMEDIDDLVDKFFPPDASEKERRLCTTAQRLREVHAELASHTDIRSMALRHLCLGKALGAESGDRYNEASHDSLKTAVKLLPSSLEAWNSLAESYWKGEDYIHARMAFNEALKVRRNKVTLRRLSMILRIIASTQSRPISDARRAAQMDTSLGLAKEAVSIDVSDGVSWYVMGNAFMGIFFGASARETVTERNNLLRQAIRAYNRAESLLGDSQIPDLFYNRGNIHCFLQEYGEAVVDFASAHRLDSTLAADTRRAMVLSFLKSCEMLSQTRRLEKKKAVSVAQRLKLLSAQNCVDFRNLNQGENPSATVIAYVVNSMPDFDKIGHIYTVMDQLQHQHLVFMSQVETHIKMGSIVTIKHPSKLVIQVQEDGTDIHLELITVFDPTSNVLVDSKSLSSSSVVAPLMEICSPHRDELGR